ncbi:TIGR03013 family XrtA/PEP-CTERM system glycosyltransferase [Thiomonas sp. FB-Cd]|uniref:TIGR03013 family XrtA/PEP-CTERM system glycosyltransferase n=1 Tax=Thiomonas sp. FB-Cd TaxID=1158292 RepID=UPI0004DF47B2|nr:TIGR03013 family XrtA/PEP-CTERM system glycosyltransferase [Thiomonas sp. FB-Cd]
MIRVFDQYVPTRTLLELSTDLIVLTFSGVLAGVTLTLAAGLHDPNLPGVQLTVLPSAIFAGVMLLLYITFGAYQRDRVNSLRMLLLCALIASMVSVGPLFFIYFKLFFPHRYALRFLGLAYCYQFVLLVLVRQPVLGGKARQLWTRAVLVVGSGPDAISVAVDIASQASGVYRVAGFYPSGHDPEPAGTLPAPLFRRESPLDDLVRQLGIDEIVVAVREQRGGAIPLRQLLECRTQGIPVHSLATFSERLKGEVPLDSLKASWMIYGHGFSQGVVRTTVKRLFDIMVSLSLLLMLWPVMLLATLAIWLEDGAPVVFRQERVGRFGKPFMVLKFRSMRKDAEMDGVARWAQANDNRITRVGRFIRKTRIDELPQLINVLKGEMSLVGPRPERPSFVEQLTEAIPYYAIRHSVKPGVSGWAQVRFSYGASLAEARRKLQFDLYYVKNHSLLLDVQIILETVRVVILGEGAR